jgi:hypothetical protein
MNGATIKISNKYMLKSNTCAYLKGIRVFISRTFWLFCYTVTNFSDETLIFIFRRIIVNGL